MTAPVRRPTILPILLALAFLPAGCTTPEEAREQVDSEAYAVLAAKQEQMTGERHPFTIDPLAGRVAEQWVDPETGLVNPDIQVQLDLAGILEIAALNSREFQNQKETLYRAALALMREQYEFDVRPPFWNFDGSATSSRSIESVATGSQFGISKMLERGGVMALSLGADFLRFVSSPTSESLGSFLNLTVSLPFFRNAGRLVVYENLRQADRDVLYAWRSFERFKQTYGISVVVQYLRVLAQGERIVIAENNVRSLTRAREEVEERFAEGRVSRVEVDQNLQAELSGRNNLVNTRLNLENALDGLKDLLGLPVDLKVTVQGGDLAALDALVDEHFELDEPDAMAVALAARLDFRNVVDSVADFGRRVQVAENQLDPDFNLNFSAAPVSKALKPLKYNYKDGTYSASFDLDLAIDRVRESISYRQALIALQAGVRNQEDAREGVKLDVRRSLRNLRQAAENYAITKTGLDLARRRVESTTELRLVGRASTRDFLESQDSLVRSEIDLVDRKVDYRVAYLELFRDTGVLVVGPEGLNHDVSRSLLLDRP